MLRPQKYRVIEADALKDELIKRYALFKLLVIEFFASSNSVISFTTDVWTSPNDLAFMAITAHWISSEFVVQSLLLDFIQIKGEHSGTNLEKYFSESLKAYGIYEKKLAVTLDNASNNNAFIAALMERDSYFFQGSSTTLLWSCFEYPRTRRFRADKK